MRWMDSIREATALSLQEPSRAERTGHGGRHSSTGSPGVGINSKACHTHYVHTYMTHQISLIYKLVSTKKVTAHLLAAKTLVILCLLEKKGASRHFSYKTGRKGNLQRKEICTWRNSLICNLGGEQQIQGSPQDIGRTLHPGFNYKKEKVARSGILGGDRQSLVGQHRNGQYV